MVYLAKEYHLQKLSNISEKHILTYLNYLQKKGNAASTIKTELAAIRFFHDNLPYAKYTLPTNDELELKRRTFGGVDRTWNSKEYNLMGSTGLEVTGNKRKANEILKEKISEYELKEKLEVKETDILFWEYLEQWVKSVAKRETTRLCYESYLRHHAVPYFKNLGLRLDEIKPSTLKAYYATLSKTLSKKSIRNQQGVLSKALGDAYMDDLIAINPHSKVKLLRIEQPEIKTLTMEEYRDFLKATKEHRLHLAIVLFCEMGIRRGELLGIEWKNCNLETGEIHICATRNRISKDKVEYLTKTDSSDRIMYISEYARKLLSEEKEKQQEFERVFGAEYIKNDIVIKYPDGRPYSETQITRQIGNLTEKYFGKRITPHKLRHTVASLMIDNNIPIYNVSKYLGHSGVKITEKVYIHTKKDFNRDTLNMFIKTLAENE